MKIIKQFLILLVSIVTSLQCISQDSYQNAMKQARDSINKKNYPAAIELYNSAKAFEPAKSVTADDSINSVFKLILQQKKEADNNRDSARKETIRAKALEKIADANLIIANNALKLSHANQIMYEAQGVVKLDPSLALHLASAALDSIKDIPVNDSSIFDKANRIYYENNFGETVMSGEDNQDSLGTFTNVAYGLDGKSIWTITDKLYAIKWDMSGKEQATIKLDSAYKNYVFKVLGKDSLIVYGIDVGTPQRKPGIESWVILGKGHSFTEDMYSVTDSAVNTVKDSIVLNPARDTSAGWTNRLLVFGHRAFQIKDGKLISIVSGVSKYITTIAFSHDGKLIATNGGSGSKGINVFNMQGVTLYSNSNFGDVPESLEFFPDDAMLLERLTNSLKIFKITDAGLVLLQTLYFPGSQLHSYQLSSNGQQILVSTVTLIGKQQVIQLWQNNGGYFNLYAQFKCLGSTQTSAVFAKDNNNILSSSHKIIRWSMPEKISEPFRVINTEFFTSVGYDGKEHFTAATYTNKKIRYNLDGKDSTTINDSSIQARLAAMMLDGKVVIVSEDGELQIYLSKKPIDEFLKNFRFDEFTEEQKKRYGIGN